LSGTDEAAIVDLLDVVLESCQPVGAVFHTIGRNERTVRVIEPLHLEERGGATCLIAYCRLRQAERVFRLDRIESDELVTP